MRSLFFAIIAACVSSACVRKASPDAGGPRAPCSDPGYRAGPGLSPVAGTVPFEVFQNCLWPEHARLAVGVRVAARPSRMQVERLLRGLWDQARQGLGKEFPRVAQVCAFEGPGGWSPDFLGCLNRGFEPEAEEDEGGDGGEELPELINRTPFSPSEEAARLQALLGGTVRYEETKRAMIVEGACAKSCAEALASFFRAAFAFYPAVTEVKALDYRCASLHVDVSGDDAFAAIDPWPLRRQLESAGPAGAVARMRAALARLPPGSVTLAPGLCGH